MKRAILPHLNLDKATALALPLADVEARAQFRFCFRLPDGDEEWLLARLCVVQNYKNGSSRSSVLLRPENAEADRVFVLEQVLNNTRLKEWMTPDEIENYQWDVFERDFNNPEMILNNMLRRHWIVEMEGLSTHVEFKADGNAEVVGVFQMDVGGGQLEEGFNWDNGCPCVNADFPGMSLLRTSNTEFRRQIEVQWNDPDGQLRGAVLWSHFDESQRNDFAFECNNGSWAQLRELAVAALQIRMNYRRAEIDGWCWWNIVEPGSFDVIEIDLNDKSKPSALCEDEALSLWRQTLLNYFKPVHIPNDEQESQFLPRYFDVYLNHHDLTSIEVAPPTMHELMEAQLKLREWARAHCAPDEAARLLEILNR